MPSPFNPLFRVLRRTVRPVLDPIRGVFTQRRIQVSVPLRPEDRARKRKRYHVLVDLVNLHCRSEYVVVVELGVRVGETTGHLLRYCPQIRMIHAIDLVRPDPERWPFMKEERLRFIESDSAKAAERFDDGAVDLVFIDADHSEEGVRRDIRAWLPKVREGGILAGHDYRSHTHPGVRVAVDEAFRDHPHPVNKDADKVWWVRR